jgi:molybdate transport system permease protein
MINFAPLLLSFKLALVVTLLLFLLSLPFAWWLSQTQSKLKPPLEAIVALPLVLPPSVLGFYLLIAFSPQSSLGLFLQEYLHIELLFSFWGLVVASCFYSLPFMVQPLQSGFEGLNRHMLEASYLAGKSTLKTIYAVALPNMKPALITALIITFAHTVGEFGVVLMVGGSIPDQTRVASIAIYEMVEVMAYEEAHIYSGVMLVMSFWVLIGVYIFNHKSRGVGVI